MFWNVISDRKKGILLLMLALIFFGLILIIMALIYGNKSSRKLVPYILVLLVGLYVIGMMAWNCTKQCHARVLWSEHRRLRSFRRRVLGKAIEVHLVYCGSTLSAAISAVGVASASIWVVVARGLIFGAAAFVLGEAVHIHLGACSSRLSA